MTSRALISLVMKFINDWICIYNTLSCTWVSLCWPCLPCTNFIEAYTCSMSWLKCFFIKEMLFKANKHINGIILYTWRLPLYYLSVPSLKFQLYLSKEWCMFLMGLWVWLRSVNVWSTLFLSAFHFQTLRRVSPISVKRETSKHLFIAFGLIWSVNLLYSTPAFMFSTKGDKNSTEVKSFSVATQPTYS